MKNTDPVELLLVALVAIAWVALTAIRLLLVPVVALVITLLRYRGAPRQRSAAALAKTPLLASAPEPEAPTAAPAPPWCPPTVEPLEALPVAALRRLARDAGLPRCLSRSGRRDDLLLALAMAW